MRNRTSIATERWRGAQDLARLRSVAACAAPEPQTFYAERTTFAAAGIELCDWRSTELTGSRPGAPVDTAVDLVAVDSGRVEWATASRRWVGPAKSVHLLRSSEPVHWSIERGSRLLRARLDAQQLPPHLSPDTAPASGPLIGAKLARAFATGLEQAVMAGREAPDAAPYLCRGVLNLGLALLEEVAPDSERPVAELRHRILAHIETNLGDPDLSPGSIAATFSVSLRWVHHAFNTHQTSLARHIRRRRVDSVAALLRDEQHSPRMSALAARYGFSGREQLSRAFRARYGVTVHAYFALALDGLPLPEPLDEEMTDAA